MNCIKAIAFLLLLCLIYPHTLLAFRYPLSVSVFQDSITKIQHSDSSTHTGKFVHHQHKTTKHKTLFKNHNAHININNSYLKTGKKFELNREVFGWYPHWENDYYKNINYSLLSTVAYFSYELNSHTGHPKTVHDWKTTALIDSLHTHKKKILLTVTNFGGTKNHLFLNNPTAIDTLTSNLIQLLSNRKAHGICIDFEGVKKKDKDSYTNFLITIANKLKKANSKYEIYLTIPAVNLNYTLDFKSLEKVIHRFVIMGYGYYGKTSSVAGPLAPLKSGNTWVPYNLTKSIDYYTHAGISNTQLILALPTYGNLWETENLGIHAKSKKFIGSRTYSYIKSNIENKEKVYIEPSSKSAYSSYPIKGHSNRYRQCWFENDSSFVHKIDLINKHKLAGMGIWALGYDKGYNDIWKVIHKKLGKSVPKKKKTLLQGFKDYLGASNPNSKINKIEKKMETITDYKNILLYIMCYTLFFACVGFIAAMLYPNTRAAMFNTPSLKIYFMAFILFLIIAVSGKVFFWVDDRVMMLIIGFIIGGISFYVANKIIERKKNELP